ncbi:MAG: hypothetical protein ACXVH3_33095 [Solirubrobacteraceae bacterium]
MSKPDRSKLPIGRRPFIGLSGSGNRGALRTHFTRAIDIGPTILDIAGIPMPTHIDGIEQQPMHGVTFADSPADADWREIAGHTALVASRV